MALSMMLVPKFEAEGLNSPAFVDAPQVEVGDATFIRVVKSDRRLERVLTHGVAPEFMSNVARPLAKTNIFEKLLERRCQKYNEILRGIVEEQSKVAIQLNSDDQSDGATSKAFKDQVPRVAIIEGPSEGEIDGIMLKVILEPHKEPPLYIEMKLENFQYLSEVVRVQIERDDFHQTHPRKKSKTVVATGTDELAVGLSSILTGKRASGYRLTFKSDEDGKTKSAFFDASSVAEANKIANHIYTSKTASDASGDARKCSPGVGSRGVEEAVAASDVEEEEEEEEDV